MRIVVNDIAACVSGELTILKDFYRCVRENDTENEWIFLLGDRYLEETNNITVLTLNEAKESRIRKLWFDCISGKKFIASLKPDVVFSLQNIIIFGLKIPQILYFHQPVPFQTVKKISLLKGNERELAVYQYLIAPLIHKSAKKAAKVIVQTDWMKEALLKQCEIPEDRVVIIHPNVKNLNEFINTNVFDRMSFFYPTSEVIFKNNECIFKSCKQLDEQGIDYHVEMTLPERFGTGKIHCTGRIDYQKVIENYNRSTLIFPSYIEACGYSLVEARSMGTIILASDCIFSRELLAEYENGYFFDPFKPEQLTALMKKVINNEIERKKTRAEIADDRDSWFDVVSVVKRRRVLFLTNVPSPYRVDFFNELGKLCDLTVLFEKGTSDERDDSWGNHSYDHFTGIVLNGKSTDVDKSFAPSIKKFLSAGLFDRIIVADTATPTGMYAILYMKSHRISYYIEGDGAFPKDGRGLKETIKKFLIKSATGYFSTSTMHDEYYYAYGAEKDKIHRYPFTSIMNRDVFDSPASLEERRLLRKKFGMYEEKIVVTVGQMIPRKGFDLLLNAAPAFVGNVGIYIIGGKPTNEYLNLVERNGLTNVHFVDFMRKSRLREYYRAANLFVLPTREDIWGLVVNEAMSCGLPIVTTDRCIAGLELVENGINGFIVPVSDVVALADKINVILSDEVLRDVMANNSLEKVSHYTIEKMAERHIIILFRLDLL